MSASFYGRLTSDGQINVGYAYSQNFSCSANEQKTVFTITLNSYVSVWPVVHAYTLDGTSIPSVSVINGQNSQSLIVVQFAKAPQADFCFTAINGFTYKMAASNSLTVTPQIIPFGQDATPILLLTLNSGSIKLDEFTLLALSQTSNNSTFTLNLQGTSVNNDGDVCISYDGDTYALQGYTYSAGSSTAQPWQVDTGSMQLSYPVPLLTDGNGNVIPEVGTTFQRFVVLATNQSTGAVLRSDPLIDIEKKPS